MSEYTTRQILDMIEANGGPEGLDLACKDLSGIDLSKEAIAAELEKAQERAPDETPVWYNKSTRGVNLKGVNLQGAYLRGAKLQRANLVSAKLQRADLGFAKLRRAALLLANLQEAVLLGANLQGADLAVAKLQGAILTGANLQKAHLGGGAQLQRADLVSANLQGADLAVANLQGARLGKANFKEAVLRYSHLEKVDFFGAEGLEGAYFYNAFLDNTRMRKDQLGKAIGEELDGEYDLAKEAYLALKNNFAEIGRHDDAAWAYRKERRMEKRVALKKAKDAWQEHNWKSAIPSYAKVTGDQLVEWVCDYGESFRRVLGWMAVLLFGSPLLFGLLGLLDWPDKNAEVFFRLPSPWRYGYAYLQQFLYILDAFTTANFAELRPAGVLARLLSGFVALVGIFLTGLLGFVAGNRIRRS